MLVDLFVKNYKRFINSLAVVALALDPIGCFIYFGIKFSGYRSDFHFGYALLGGLIGFLVILIIEAVSLPPMLVLFSINEKIDGLKKADESQKNSEQVNSIAEFVPCVVSGKTFLVKKDAKDGKLYCTKCHVLVEEGSEACPSCGNEF